MKPKKLNDLCDDDGVEAGHVQIRLSQSEFAVRTLQWSLAISGKVAAVLLPLCAIELWFVDWISYLKALGFIFLATSGVVFVLTSSFELFYGHFYGGQPYLRDFDQ